MIVNGDLVLGVQKELCGLILLESLVNRVNGVEVSEAHATFVD